MPPVISVMIVVVMVMMVPMAPDHDGPMVMVMVVVVHLRDLNPGFGRSDRSVLIDRLQRR